jgi:transposase
MLELDSDDEFRMYQWDTLVLLKHLLEQGLSKTAIAARAGVSRGLIYHLLRSGQLERDLSLPRARRRAAVPQALDPYKPIIDSRLATYPELSAVRLFAECRAAGYPGSYTQLRLYVRAVRPTPAPEPLVRFETAPGQQAQVDFAEVRLPWGKRHALLIVLGYSRLLWVGWYPRQTMQTLMHGLEAAFLQWGGVPREILFDQLKAVVSGDERPQGGRLLENPEFLRFAAHWGFRIRACRPYRAKTKGKVERPIRYLRSNFLYGREFLGDADLQAQSEQWLVDVANARVHRTTGAIPAVRFITEELPALGPRPSGRYQPLIRVASISLVPASDRGVAVPVERRALTAYNAVLAEDSR